jgi:hypothetical protein
MDDPPDLEQLVTWFCQRVKTDVVTLGLTKDEVGALPPVAVRRWPRPLEHRGPRR